MLLKPSAVGHNLLFADLINVERDEPVDSTEVRQCISTVRDGKGIVEFD